MADLNDLPNLLQSAAAFQAAYADATSGVLSTKVNRNQSLTLASGRRIVLAQWANFLDGCAVVLQDDLAERRETGRVRVGGRDIYEVTASPEGSVTAEPGSLALQDDGVVWRKASGSGNTGWVNVASAGDLYLPVGTDASATLVYLSMNADANSASITEGWVNWLAPYDCTVVEAVMRVASGADYGSTTVGSHIDGNTSASDTDTQDLDLSDGAVTFTLGTDVDAGQLLAISFDGTSNGGEMTGYVRIAAR